MTAILWVPYTLDRIAVRGLLRTMGNPQADDAPLHDWAQRAYYAHTNAIENLVVFGVLVLIANAAGMGNDGAVVVWAGVFFYARLLHFVVYTAVSSFARIWPICSGLSLDWPLFVGWCEVGGGSHQPANNGQSREAMK